MQQLCDEEAVQTKIRLVFLSFLAEQTKTFLTLLQSEQPMIHVLMSLALTTFQNISKLVLKGEKVPKTAKEVVDLDLEDQTILLHSRNCGYLVNLDEELARLSGEQRKNTRSELRTSTLTMLKYLPSRIPFNKPIYQQFGFIDPAKRTEISMPKHGVAVTTFLNRFIHEE